MAFEREKNYTYFSDNAAFVQHQNIKQYCHESPFDPSDNYPEFTTSSHINPANQVYGMVRNLLFKLGMDEEKFNTPKWNPFKNIVKPGTNVLIKPNLVTHRHYLGDHALYGSITHGSILRPIIDYVDLAQKGEGSITIADNPVAGADFESLMNFTGIHSMVERLVDDGFNNLQLMDLRPKIWKEDGKGGFCYESAPGDPLDYTMVDLGSNSMFAEFDANSDIHYYTLADPVIDHFDPKCIKESSTDKYHNPKNHRYLVSNTVLNSDVIINVAKMKTHCKAGVSLGLKNMIGIVHLKECMPHHRPGPPPFGDSFPHYPAMHYIALRKFYRSLRKWLRIHQMPGFKSFRDSLQRNQILIDQHIEHGNWKGNDTIWRTILDLNRIVLYADKKGKMRDTPQRMLFTIIDGIIAQHGNGPMSGDPLPCSILFGGYNPVIVDALAIKAIGVDYHLIKSIGRAQEIQKWRLMPEDKPDLYFKGNKVPKLNFIMPKGWN